MVRRIFTDRAAGITVREICRRLNADTMHRRPASPAWGPPRSAGCCATRPTSAGSTTTAPNRCPTGAPPAATEQVPRDRDEWIPIDCPRIISDELFQAASRVATDNTKWSPRRAEPGQWLLKGLVKCGVCGVGTRCHKMRGRNGTWHRYYYCRNHDPSAPAANNAAAPNATSAPTP